MQLESILSGDRFKPPKKKKEPAEEPEEPQKPKTGPFIVSMTEEAKKEYEAVPGNVKESMQEIMDRLKAWPEVSGVRSLFGKGYAPNKFRMKTWDWRMEFLVNPTMRTITVVRIGHRDTFYDEYH
jgi:mRNA-degrading endonuclease RelE of RelBE toxin-antitoxin system